jgi:hypothetical protein
MEEETMKKRFTSRLGLLLAAITLLTSTVPAQVLSAGRLTGVVTDAQGAVIPNAQIVAKHDQTQSEYKLKANDEGGWSIPSLPNGVYTVTVTAAGFKSTIVQNVKVDAGSATTVNASLEVGGTTEQVIVTGGGSIIQTESANVSSTIVGRQIGELPWATRDAMQLVLTLPGVQTPGTPRTSSVNSLPKSAINILLDGANIQDNFLKSSDGFFTSIQAKSDAVEEVTVSTATPGAESAGGGAVQIKFVTKQGSNDFRGALFWQHRNTWLNANYYFNNIDGLPRDHLILNQAGGNIGGPIMIPKIFNGRDKAFFFVNFEEFRLPQTYNGARTVLTDSALQGIFTYKDTAGNLRNVNLYSIAAARNATLPASIRPYATTPDPTIFEALGLVNEASKKGSLLSRIGTNNDYNRLDLTYQDPGRNIRRFPTVRLDFNLNKDHHLEFVHNYQHYFSDPDGVNGQINVYPGTGIVVGAPGVTGSIYRNAFSFVMAERWTITNRVVNEIRLTSSGNGTSLFTREFAPGLWDFWGGNAVFESTAYFSGFQSRSTQSRRNTPVKGLSDTVSWLKGTHAMNFGVDFTRIASFTQAVGRHTVPGITIGIASGDPINTGATSIFTAANFPGSSATDRTLAARLYALLTGRVTNTTRTATYDPETNTFGFVPTDEYSHQNELGIYAQDSWKMKQNLTVNYGLRWQYQPSPINDNGVYTRNGLEGIYGISGPGNLFRPGVFEGIVPEYRLLGKEKAFADRYRDFAPTVGIAWQPDFKNGLLTSLFGSAGQTVLRTGYSIAYAREGFNAFNTMFGFNEVPAISLGLSSAVEPAEFVGPGGFSGPGSVYFRDGTFPFRSAPQPSFPFTARQNQSINDFNPNIKAGYVQSWTFGIQRELTKDTALEIRYVGNHGTHLWRQYGVNEVNIFENGFLDEFNIAMENLRIARNANPASNNFGNTGLPGQMAIPIISTALGTTNDITFATAIARGEAGRLAANIASNVTRMNRLIAANLIPFATFQDPNNPAATLKLSNYFVVNPLAALSTALPTSGNSFIMDNGAGNTYNALQIDLRRRLSNGLLVQGSYVFSKSLTNFFANDSAVFSQPTTLRDFEYDKGPSPFDIRHAFKIDWIHELPVGPGRRFLNTSMPVARKLLEGWQWGGVARIQSGSPLLLTSGRFTFNNRDSGVVLNNISREQLQALVKFRKETVCDESGECQGVVFWLPKSIIDNTLAAFEIQGTLNPNLPYIGPPTKPGELGSRIFLYGPMTARFDFNVMKRTRITETANFEFRVQFLNAFNRANFFLDNPGNSQNDEGIGTEFGQTRFAYRDITVSGTNDPGGRLVEFQLRLNF